jgi:hypothetical protein
MTPYKSSSNETASHPFIKLYGHDTLCDLIAENPTAARILIVMAHNSDSRGRVMVSRQVLSNIVERSMPTVSKAINYLKEHQVIAVISPNGWGRPSTYMISSQVFWKSSENRREYAAFDVRPSVPRNTSFYTSERLAPKIIS